MDSGSREGQILGGGKLPGTPAFKVPMTPKFLLHDVKEYLKL